MSTIATKRQPTKRETIVEEMMAKEVAAFDQRAKELINEMFADAQKRKQAAVKCPSLPSKPARRKSA